MGELEKTQVEVEFAISQQYRVPVTYVRSGDIQRYLDLPPDAGLEGFLRDRPASDRDLYRDLFVYLSVRRGLSAVEILRLVPGYTPERVTATAQRFELEWRDRSSFPGFGESVVPPSDAAVAAGMDWIHARVREIESRPPRLLTPRDWSNPSTPPSAGDLYVTDFTLTRARYVTRPASARDDSLEPLRLFDRTRVDSWVPYIQYNAEPFETAEAEAPSRARRAVRRVRQRLYKLYENVDCPTEVPSVSRYPRAHTLYLNVRVDDEEGAGCRERALAKATYNLTEGVLAIDIPVSTARGRREELQRVVQRLNYALHTVPLTVEQFVDTSVSGSFQIVNADVDPWGLMTMISAYSPMTYFLHPHESKASLYTTKEPQMPIGMRDPAEAVTGVPGTRLVTATLVPFRAGQSGHVLFTESETMNLPPGSSYLQVNVTKAAGRASVARFTRLLGLALRIMRSPEGQTFTDFYAQNRPPLEPRTASRSEAVRIRQLTREVPELFISPYARSCGQARQPEIISETEAQRRLAVRHERNGTAYHAAILYPDPRISPALARYARWYACPNETHPVPGLASNPQMANRRKFPFFPCCFDRVDDAQGERSKYQTYYSATTERTSVSKELVRQKILKPDQIGELPRKIIELFRGLPLNRFGVWDEGDIFLNCLLYATDLNYRRSFHAQDYESLDDYSRLLRARLRSLHPGLLRQELYDLSPHEINEQFVSADTVLESHLHYRAFEELLGVNIFVFMNDESGILEIPRHRSFYVRPKNSRPSIILYKFQLRNDLPHYELVGLGLADRPAGQSVEPLFGVEITAVLFEAFRNTHEEYILRPARSAGSTMELVPRLEQLVDLRELFRDRAWAQYIDVNGKLRALVVNVGGVDGTVVLPPTQPLNLPTWDRCPSLPPHLVSQIVADPPVARSAISPGLWYTVDGLRHAVYLPLTSDEPYASLPVEFINPVYNTVGQRTEEGTLHELKRRASLLWQFVRWLFILFVRSRPPGTAPSAAVEAFATNHLLLSPTSYHVTERVLRLPVTDSVNDALLWLSQTYPSFATAGGLRIESTELWRRVVQRVVNYARHLTPWTPTPRQLVGLFDTPEEFESRPYTVVFTSREALDSWIRTSDRGVGSGAPFTIQSRLNAASWTSITPPIYRTQHNTLYLIQNMRIGHINNALYVSWVWLTRRRNLGRDAVAQIDLDLSSGYVIYGLDEGGHLVTREAPGAREGTDYLEVLEYSPDLYAAVLPLVTV